MDDDSEGGRYRRLPPRVRPTGTEQDVSLPPPPATEARYVSWLSTGSGAQAYEQMADQPSAETEPRRGWRGIAALAFLGAGLLVALLILVF